MTQVAYPYHETDAATRRVFRMEAFVTGYHHGSISGLHCSPREVYERFPSWATAQVEAYLNGRDDGVKRDSFRFVMVSSELRLPGSVCASVREG